MVRITFISLACLISYYGTAQQSSSKKSFLQAYSFYNAGEEQLTHDKFFDLHEEKMGLTDNDEFILAKSDKGTNGYHHYRYQQNHNGIKVIGADYIIHTRDEHITSANGKFLPEIKTSTKPKLNEGQALDFAMEDMNAEFYSWQVDNKTKSGKPEVELVIMDKDFPKFSGDYKLAYRIELRSLRPVDGQEYFIDALNGMVLNKISLHKDGGVPATGTTRYYGDQAITIDSISENEYVLRDPTRGSDGINVYDNGVGNIFTTNSTSVDLTNESQDEVAVDALYLTAEYYDLLRDEFDWLGLNNEDASMNVCVHARAGAEYVNAYWDGGQAWFGDGDCNHGPLVTAEVLAHEFMHGIIDQTSKLVYRDESGAINESMADVMGQYLEYKLDKNNFSWDLGGSFELQEKVEPIRVLDNPIVKGHPEFYRGPLWRDGANVHTNSAIGNLLFVMLSDGNQGVDIEGLPYSVTGIGIEQAAKYLFHINRNYLTSTSTYTDYYYASLLAAEEFFQADATILQNLEEAWRAVGVTQTLSEDLYDLVVSSRGYVPSCDWEDYEAAVFSISNEGAVPYRVQEAGFVRVSSGAMDQEVLLDMDILPGETIEFKIDSFVQLTNNFISVQYQLFVDDLERGNSSLDSYFVTEHMEKDLDIAVEVSKPQCFKSEYNLAFKIRNMSCTELSDGTPFTVKMQNAITGEVIFAETFKVEGLLFPGARATYERSLYIDLTESTYFDVTLDFSEDNNPDDNNEEVLIEYIQPVEGQYFNGFDSEAAFSREILLTTDFSSSHIYEFDGDSKFYTTGFFAEADEPLCFDPNRNWDKDPERIFDPLSAQLKTCLDLEGMGAMAVQFDLTQYRDDSSEFASDGSSAMRLRIADGDSEETHTIKSQPEGEIVSYSFPLPYNFRGSVELLFLTQTGNEPSLDYDVMLLNDFVVGGGVAVLDEGNESTFSVYPNPAAERLFIKGFSDEEVLVEITNAAGLQVLIMNKGIGQNELSISGLYPGYYNVSLRTLNGTVYRTHFIRM